jgi:hypothetical protein
MSTSADGTVDQSSHTTGPLSETRLTSSTQGAQPPAQEEVQGRRWTRQGLWLSLGTAGALLLVQIVDTLAFGTIGSSLDYSLETILFYGSRALVVLAVCVVATLVSPAAPRQRLFAWAWFAPAFIILALQIAYSSYFYQHFYGSFSRESSDAALLVALSLFLSLVTGGWLALRGRSGVAFLALIAVPVVTIVTSAAAVAAPYFLFSLFSSLHLPSLLYNITINLGYQYALLVTVVATAWVAAALATRRTHTTQTPPPDGR